MALAGSTNAVLHLLAIAHESGVDLALEDFDRVSERTPLLADMKPWGRFTAPDLGRAGGIMLVMRRLLEAGARLAANPWGDPAFGAYFFLLTGFHGTHVLTGVVTLAVTAGRVSRRLSTATGVEMAGMLAEISRHTLKGEFRRFDPRNARVVLVEGMDRVLPPYAPDLSERARVQLERLGVTVWLGRKITGIDAEGVQLPSPARLEPRDLARLAAGAHHARVEEGLAARLTARQHQLAFLQSVPVRLGFGGHRLRQRAVGFHRAPFVRTRVRMVGREPTPVESPARGLDGTSPALEQSTRVRASKGDIQ